jgi:ferrochelatase
MAAGPYDAFLLLSFGGPESPDEVVPFLRRVTEGRGIPDERLREVGAHYFHFGGVSPINQQNRDLIADLEAAFADAGLDLPVHWGNLYAEPFIPDAVRALHAGGARRVLSFATSMYASAPGCRRYREAVEAACVIEDDPALLVQRLRHGFDHPGFLEPFADGVAEAVAHMPEGTRLAFTTHSLPLATAMASGPPGRPAEGSYVAQHRAAAGWVAHEASRRCGRDLQWDLVFQSRSGPPSVPWLGPSIDDHLVELAAEGVPGAIVVPIGFVSDHIEVLWDLDVQAAATAHEAGLAFARIPTPAGDPRFVAMIVDLVRERLEEQPPGARAALSPLGPSWDACDASCCVTVGRP